MQGPQEQHIAHCNSCGCKMDTSALGPYTNVVCPECGEHTRVKCELDQYLLIDRYAIGGMSTVFTARDVTLEREVAIKILSEDYSQDEARMQQFEHEARITAAISHPHVVRVFTVGKAFERFYIAMEMVPGENLEQKISREGAIGEDTMLPIASEIISGLRAAKQAGLIHRDVKPGNILFDAAGHVKIVDFGLALVAQGGKAKAEEIWATPYYVPPETLDGKDEDFRSDIYALGATLYHALSGHPPISDDLKTTGAVRKAKEHVVPLAELAPQLHPETCHLVSKAMALRPADRFSSYTEMGKACLAASRATQGGHGAEPVQSNTGNKHKIRKNGLVSLIISALLALALVALAINIFLNKKQNTNEGEVPESPSANQKPEIVDDAKDYNPELAAKIGRQFRASHRLLKERKYDDAKKMLERLMNDEQVHEPTASWAGVEAVIATWLGGDSAGASSAIADLQEHLKSRGISTAQPIGRLGAQLDSPRTIRDVVADDDAMAVAYFMAVALKNWEMGVWDAALPMFENVIKYPLPPESPLLVYRDIAQRYLSDFEKLKPYSDLEPPTSEDEAREQLSELGDLLGNIETKGRARFHIRVWQLRLHHQIKAMHE